MSCWLIGTWWVVAVWMSEIFTIISKLFQSTSFTWYRLWQGWFWCSSLFYQSISWLDSKGIFFISHKCNFSLIKITTFYVEIFFVNFFSYFKAIVLRIQPGYSCLTIHRLVLAKRRSIRCLLIQQQLEWKRKQFTEFPDFY